ncbi:MAG: hypothetical protein ACYCS0_05310 [bacterium]
MKKDKSFLNKKYRIFLFLPLAAIAISYLIGATDISYMLNVPMIMSPVQAGMSMNMEQTGQAEGKQLSFFLKTAGGHSNKLNLQSYVTCVECQNLPAAYRPVMFYYGGIIKTVPPKRQFYIKHFSSDIPHPPQNSLTLFS